MKRSSPLVRRGGEVDMDSAMTPMIDVVFLLLVFFVWTASFQVVEHVLVTDTKSLTGSAPVEQAVPEPPKEFPDVVVKLGWDGNSASWKISDQDFGSLAALKKKLITIADIGVDAPLIVAPQPAVPLGHVIECYDVAKDSGFAQVSFAVNPQER